MSPSWRERIAVAIEPRALRAKRLRTGEERVSAGRWQDVLAQILEGWPAAAVSVVLSNRLVRYALVPPSGGVRGEDEELGLARHHFVRVHGERAREWHLRYSPATGLASAIDKALLDQLQQSLGKRLVSLQPYLMVAYNRCRARIPADGAWFVLPEGEATCVALFQRGAWAGVSVSRANPEEALAREQVRMGGADAPRTVLGPGESERMLP